MQERPVFLSAEWRYLLMLNYAIDPAILQPYVPQGTEIDFWNGRTYVSIVGFLFENTKVLGVKIPFHVNFEELNLRFYVRYRGSEGWRRGVVFIKEIVPRWAIATVARVVYNEAYVAMPMQHEFHPPRPHPSDTPSVEYRWRFNGEWQVAAAQTLGTARPLTEGSEAQFITEHYWGYAKQRDGGTMEYQVKHPSWNVWKVEACRFECDVAALYGDTFAEPLRQEPTSVFVADGSAVTVHKGVRI